MLQRAIFSLWLVVLGLAVADTPAAEDAISTSHPKVVLVGDSIRLSYAPQVASQLAGKAVVVSPRANGGDSSNVLKHLEEWVIREKPAVVFFNCGIHDTKKFKSTGKFQVSPQQYAANLREIVQRIRNKTEAVVLFATTTPILDDRAAQARRDRDYELLNASVVQYNEIAQGIMNDLEVPVCDLYATLRNHGQPTPIDDLIVSDGVHPTPAGRELLGDTVAAFVSMHLPTGK